MVLATVLRKSTDGLRKYGPIVLAVLTVAILDEYRGGVYFTLAPLFAVMAIGIYYGGTVTGGIIGLVIATYSAYSLYDVSLIRSAIIIVSVILIIAPFAILRRALDNTDSILDRLREIDILTTGLLARWHNMSEAEKRQTIEQIQHKVANLLTLTIGWLTLAREQGKVSRRDKAG
jgi:hypothetical protein